MSISHTLGLILHWKLLQPYEAQFHQYQNDLHYELSPLQQMVLLSISHPHLNSAVESWHLKPSPTVLKMYTKYITCTLSWKSICLWVFESSTKILLILMDIKGDSFSKLSGDPASITSLTCLKSTNPRSVIIKVSLNI